METEAQKNDNSLRNRTRREQRVQPWFASALEVWQEFGMNARQPSAPKHPMDPPRHHPRAGIATTASLSNPIMGTQYNVASGAAVTGR
jgi:hypothetical protein